MKVYYTEQLELISQSEATEIVDQYRDLFGIGEWAHFTFLLKNVTFPT